MRPQAVVVVGASWGGVDALRFFIGGLSRDFPAPVVVVQHRGNDGDDALAGVLQAESAVEVREVEDKDALKPGLVYLAPSGYHVLVEGHTLALSVDDPVSWARPSIDVLFESAAEAFRHRTVGVILTGAGKDGPDGLRAVKRHGGLTVVQNPQTAESRILPEAAIAAVKPDRVLPLPEIVPFISRHIRNLPAAHRER